MRLTPRRAAHRWPGLALHGDHVVTSVRTWSPPDHKLHPVILVGIQHMGTDGYYAEIVDLADANPDAVVLYEGMRPGSLGEDEPIRISDSEARAVFREQAAGVDVSHRQTASLLGLALHQPSLAPNYDRPHWHNGDLHMIDIMRAIGVDPAGTTAIDGSSAWLNTLFTAQAQAAAAVAAREDRRGLDFEQARAETDRIAQDIRTGVAPPKPGVSAAVAARVARAAETDPLVRLSMMNTKRSEIRWMVAGRPWPIRLLHGVVFAVTWPFRVKSWMRNRAIARRRANVIHHWRDFHVMSMAMRRAQESPVIVIFGAAHTPAHSEYMFRNRFTETDVSWLEVMSVANPKGEDRERVLAELAAMLADPVAAGTTDLGVDGTAAVDHPAADTPVVGQR